ncbi:hypothetical protein PUR21_31075 [Methylorubrum rhodesianum]|uniref:Uncharacterized protein n=1 Tax=Methylorubrum rhodesianum TaxID=29427 RepID=A0ABU9ZM77_9HYPH
MWFSSIFKSRHQREVDRLKKKADLERALDAGKAASKQTLQILDNFFEQRAEPVAIAMMKIWRERIEITHKLEITDAISEYQIVMAEIQTYREQMFGEAKDALGEWKYLAIEVGFIDSIEKYIEQKITNIVDLMNSATRDDVAYAAARIKGIISDEQHTMSPEELKADIEKKRRDQLPG